MHRSLGPLRVAYPADSGSGYTIVTLADGSKDGSVVEFILRCQDIHVPVVPQAKIS